MMRLVVVMVAMVVLQGCSWFEKEDLKSPCVGAEGSPCGPHRSVNDWWVKSKV